MGRDRVQIELLVLKVNCTPLVRMVLNILTNALNALGNTRWYFGAAKNLHILELLLLRVCYVFRIQALTGKFRQPWAVGIKVTTIQRGRQRKRKPELKVPIPKGKSCKMGKEAVSHPFSHSVYARLLCTKDKLKDVEIRFQTIYEIATCHVLCCCFLSLLRINMVALKRVIFSKPFLLCGIWRFVLRWIKHAQCCVYGMSNH